MKFSFKSYNHVGMLSSPHSRELKQQGRQRQPRKTIGLMSKNNCSARAFYILVHFFAVLCKTASEREMTTFKVLWRT